jgi:hypothetical protein
MALDCTCGRPKPQFNEGSVRLCTGQLWLAGQTWWVRAAKMERSPGLRLRFQEVPCHREEHDESSLGIVPGGRRPRRLCPIQTARGEQGQVRAAGHLGRSICHDKRAEARRIGQEDRFRRRSISGCRQHLSEQRDVRARQGNDGRPRPDPDSAAPWDFTAKSSEDERPRAGGVPRSVRNPTLHLRTERRHPADLFGPNQCRGTANRLHRWAREQPRLRRLPTPSALSAFRIASLLAVGAGQFRRGVRGCQKRIARSECHGCSCGVTFVSAFLRETIQGGRPARGGAGCCAAATAASWPGTCAADGMAAFRGSAPSAVRRAVAKRRAGANQYATGADTGGTRADGAVVDFCSSARGIVVAELEGDSRPPRLSSTVP